MRGAEHREQLFAGNNRAAVCGHQGKLGEAAALLEESLTTSRRVLGARHPDTVCAAENLAITYTRLGKDAEAAAVRALPCPPRARPPPAHGKGTAVCFQRLRSPLLLH